MRQLVQLLSNLNHYFVHNSTKTLIWSSSEKEMLICPLVLLKMVLLISQERETLIEKINGYFPHHSG